MQIPEIPHLIHFAIPFFIITVIIEVILTVKIRLEEYEFKDAATSIAMGLGNVFLGLISKSLVLTVFLFFYQSWSQDSGNPYISMTMLMIFFKSILFNLGC